jgi:hypothetical protein
MKTMLSGVLALVLFATSPSVQAEPWPWKDEPSQEAFLSVLRLKLWQDGVWKDARLGKKEKGIWLFLEVEDEDAKWLKVVVRGHHMKGSGADPNVSPAIARFNIRKADGVVFWYDVVEDAVKSYDDFLESIRNP